MLNVVMLSVMVTALDYSTVDIDYKNSLNGGLERQGGEGLNKLIASNIL